MQRVYVYLCPVYLFFNLDLITCDRNGQVSGITVQFLTVKDSKRYTHSAVLKIYLYFYVVNMLTNLKYAKIDSSKKLASILCSYFK